MLMYTTFTMPLILPFNLSLHQSSHDPTSIHQPNPHPKPNLGNPPHLILTPKPPPHSLPPTPLPLLPTPPPLAGLIPVIITIVSPISAQPRMSRPMGNMAFAGLSRHLADCVAITHNASRSYWFVPQYRSGIVHSLRGVGERGNGRVPCGRWASVYHSFNTGALWRSHYRVDGNISCFHVIFFTLSLNIVDQRVAI